MSANEHIEELLSGFLDGELSAEELRELESAMSADPTLGQNLEQLRQIGNDLRSVPKRKLAPDFAGRVLAAVRQEALVSDEIELKHVRKGFQTPALPDSRRRWRAIGALAAVAASLFLVMYVSDWFPGAVSIPDGNVAVDPLPRPDPKRKELDPNLREMAPEPEKEGSAFVRNAPIPKNAPSPLNFGLMPVFEIEPSPTAWKENEVAKILLNAGIVWTDPVIASDDVIRVLNETRSINHDLKNPGDEQLALVMVRARGSEIDKALNVVYARTKDFPLVVMDVAFDIPGKELFEKVPVGGSVATPVTRTFESRAKSDLESVSQFASAPLPKGRQSARFEAPAMAAEDEVTFVLLVIRKPATK